MSTLGIPRTWYSPGRLKDGSMPRDELRAFVKQYLEKHETATTAELVNVSGTGQARISEALRALGAVRVNTIRPPEYALAEMAQSITIARAQDEMSQPAPMRSGGLPTNWFTQPIPEEENDH